MQRGYRAMRDSINSYPSLLLSAPRKFQQIANNLIPRNTGIEIECLQGPNFDIKYFQKIKLEELYIAEEEHKFQIHAGIKGMNEIFKVCECLKEYSLFTDSGIHYHINTGPHFKMLREMKDTKWDCEDYNCFSWVLKELEAWNYKGAYNSKRIGNEKKSWVYFHQYYSTAEFRIGEMSFDYELIIKRILHCHSIVKRMIRQGLEPKQQKKD